MKALDVPIMLSPLGEFGLASSSSYGEAGFLTAQAASSVCEAYGDPGWPDGPERTRDLIRHIIDVFREVEVPNVTWFMYASTGYADAPLFATLFSLPPVGRLPRRARRLERWPRLGRLPRHRQPLGVARPPDPQPRSRLRSLRRPT